MKKILFSIPLISENKVGFRFSKIDIFIIVLTGIITYFYLDFIKSPNELDKFFHYLIPYIVTNFFLFCNVFRVKTKYELCWLLIATINITLYLFQYKNILLFFLTQSFITMIIVIIQVKTPTYNGIFSKILLEEK